MTPLVRVRAGKYRTPDGAFDVIEDPRPEAHRSDITGTPLRAPRRVWMIFAKGEDEPLYYQGCRGYGSLREARDTLPAARAYHEAEVERYETRHRLLDVLAGILLARGGQRAKPSSIVWSRPAGSGCP